MAVKTYYEILDLETTAKAEEVRQSYRLHSAAWHPDKHSGSSKKVAEEKMKVINEAYQVLSNPQSRAEYDRELALRRRAEETQQQAEKAQQRGEEERHRENQQQAEEARRRREAEARAAEERRRREEELRRENQRRAQETQRKQDGGRGLSPVIGVLVIIFLVIVIVVLVQFLQANL